MAHGFAYDSDNFSEGEGREVPYQSQLMDFIKKWAPNFLNPPQCITPMTALRINGEGMCSYFRSVRDTIVSCIYPDFNYNKSGIISADQFATVCRYLVLARCDYVYQSTYGEMESNAVSYTTCMKLPKSIADPINGLGVAELCPPGLKICPRGEETRDWIPDDIDKLLSSFGSLVTAAELRRIISTDSLSREITGNCWYAVGAMKSVDNSAVAVQEDMVQAQCCFQVATEDAVLAAIVQRGFDGIIPELCIVAPFQTRVDGCLSLRIQYARAA